MTKVTDLYGHIFGGLEVTEFVGLTPNKQAVWKALCSCGAITVVRARELVSGDTKSCGCHKSSALRMRNREAAKHQRSRSAEYRSWQSMKQRCLNPTKEHDKKNYEGVYICAEWVASFEAFLSDMGNKPSAAHTLDRIDRRGHYTPENCRWADKRQQATNRSSTVLIRGKSMAEWARELGVTPAAIKKRIQRTGDVYGNDARR